ncbi:hypothetical protein ACFX2I_015638 [Malus domestica]
MANYRLLIHFIFLATFSLSPLDGEQLVRDFQCSRRMARPLGPPCMQPDSEAHRRNNPMTSSVPGVQPVAPTIYGQLRDPPG